MSIANTTSDGINLGASLARGVDNASDGMHRAIDRATDAARPAVNSLSSGAHHTIEKIASAASHAAESVQATGGQLRDAQSRAISSFRRQLNDQPVATIGIAIAVGFLLNWALRQR